MRFQPVPVSLADRALAPFDNETDVCDAALAHRPHVNPPAFSMAYAVKETCYTVQGAGLFTEAAGGPLVRRNTELAVAYCLAHPRLAPQCADAQAAGDRELAE